MATVRTAISKTSTTPALLLPSSSNAPPISFAHLSTLTTTFQSFLSNLDIQPTDRIAISLFNSPEFIIAFLATSFQRATAAPLNPAYTVDENEFYIQDSEAVLVVVPRGAVEGDTAVVKAARKHGAGVAECWYDAQEATVHVELKLGGKVLGARKVKSTELLWPEPSDVALLLHTSGTTGRPKAVPLTHRNLTTTMRNIVATYALTETDRTYLVMPLFHVHGLLAGLLAPLSAGGSAIVPPRFSAREFWKDFVAGKANWYTAVPSIHQILLKGQIPDPVPTLRFVRSCSSPLSPTVFAELERVLGAPVLEAYAMTEAAHQMTSNPLPPGKRKAGSVGVGQGVEVRILDSAGKRVDQGGEGEICVRGENVTEGYFNNAAANESSFTEDRFFRTGDQGKLDGEGYVFITGRIKELINKGGEKISPVELDNVVAQHPAVAEGVSFAIEDDILGQNVGVAVVKREGADLTAEELKSWLATKVAKFKVPKTVWITEVMPKTATGKIQRRVVAETMVKQGGGS